MELLHTINEFGWLNTIALASMAISAITIATDLLRSDSRYRDEAKTEFRS